jgi:hypothetical protein
MKRSYIGVALCVFAFCLVPFSAVAEQRLGADRAEPAVTAMIATFSAIPGKTTVLSDEQVASLIGLSASLGINVFELIDCIHRAVTPKNIRLALLGTSLRKAQERYDFGGSRVLAILPIAHLTRLETGASVESGQYGLDLYLDSVQETYIEIGTARYETRCGFKTVSPLLFSDAYGITVKKVIFKTPLESLELYEPAKGAIYVEGVSRPKRWNFNVVSEKK